MYATTCPVCNGLGYTEEKFDLPIPYEATPFERQNWPEAETIRVVCQACGGTRYEEKTEGRQSNVYRFSRRRRRFCGGGHQADVDRDTTTPG
jgi:RecJ-like exonuclease